MKLVKKTPRQTPTSIRIAWTGSDIRRMSNKLIAGNIAMKALKTRRSLKDLDRVGPPSLRGPLARPKNAANQIASEIHTPTTTPSTESLLMSDQTVKSKKELPNKIITVKEETVNIIGFLGHLKNEVRTHYTAVLLKDRQKVVNYFNHQFVSTCMI